MDKDTSLQLANFSSLSKKVTFVKAPSFNKKELIVREWPSNTQNILFDRQYLQVDCMIILSLNHN